MASNIELSITWNGIKIAKLHIDNLPWWLSTVIAILPKGTLCVCASRNYDHENEQIKKIMTASNYNKTE